MDKLTTITSKVIVGHNIGSTIGFPTANLENTPAEDLIKPGSYAAHCYLNSEPNKKYKALAYFGPRTIFGQTKNTFEVHILNFNGEIYGKTLTVELEQYLREPQIFHSMRQLQKALEIDKKNALEFWGQKKE